MICKFCGKDISTEIDNYSKDFCSYTCYERWSRYNKLPNCECVVCHRKMYLRPSRLQRVKNGITCSKECAYILKSNYSSGKNNHQFGLTGDKNSSFKGKETISNLGYVLEYAPGHPFPHDKSVKGNRVLQHRLMVERNYERFDLKYFTEIDGIKYLKPDYIVHHINGIKTDNRVENLQILTKSEHSSLHNKENELVRDSLGKIVGVKKSGKIGGNLLLKENTEINSEIAEGSESSYSIGSE